MLNIVGLPVDRIRVVNNGYDDYGIRFHIRPSSSEDEWVPLTDSGWVGCRSFGARALGETIKFCSVEQAVKFVEREYGRYGISLLVDGDSYKVDVSKFLTDK